MKLVALVHVTAYPLLVWLVWTWLGIAESSVISLAGSAVLAVSIIVAISWLLATAFDGELRVRATWIRSLLFVIITLWLVGVTLWLRNRNLWVSLLRRLVRRSLSADYVYFETGGTG
jgi:hypothetical protein